MRTALLIPVVGVALAAAASTGPVGAMDAAKMVAPPDITWGPAPASLPPGAEAALLYGDPAKDGMFALRLKLPAGYLIPPHTHPRPEVVTVISGTFRLGMGETADERKAEALPAGSFFAFEPDMAHYAFAEGETVVQITTNGPWGITYVNPKDDPRKKTH
ncbi:cupin domain-containing protein [Marinimicrococcus flavescens]|uniref:Cupin domain-containing protein n=1 Tax=Marinimicrococcus flavescens TaxID=3031815 RepID=A0AAP4D6T1_9PROT|nr:cupin domain-containing protein [Marinimicrococcus flavescens]